MWPILSVLGVYYEVPIGGAKSGSVATSRTDGREAIYLPCDKKYVTPLDVMVYKSLTIKGLTQNEN